MGDSPDGVGSAAWFENFLTSLVGPDRDSGRRGSRSVTDGVRCPRTGARPRSAASAPLPATA
ncbi:hypothetical protein AMK11_35450 [Streptomyces sp. CB02414]|nr:hypothetical protein AMK11_35450 [Streptomyces sp. CB02414]